MLRAYFILASLTLGVLLSQTADAAVTSYDRESCRNRSTPPRIRIEACNLVLKELGLEREDKFTYTYSRALAYRAQKRFDLAAKDLTRALEINPKSAEAYYLRGWINFRDRKWEEALRDLNASIFHRPDYFQALMSRAHLKRRTRDYRGAISDYSTALKLKPKHSKGFSARGAAYFQLGKLDRAKKDFIRAIRLDKRSHEALAKRGALHAVNGAFDAAIADYDRAIRLDRKNVDYRLRRARLLHGNGFNSRAMNELTEMRRTAPNNVPIMVVTSSVWLSLEEPAKAKKVMKVLIRKVGRAKAHILRGEELLLQGRYRLARADAEKAVAANKNAGQAHGLHAVALLRLQRLAEAEDAAGRAIRINGRNTQYLMTRAAIRWQAGNHLESDKDIRRARRVDVHLPVARKARGWFHHEMVRALLRLNGYDAGSRTPFADGRFLIALADFQEANDLPISKSVSRRALKILQDHKI